MLKCYLFYPAPLWGPGLGARAQTYEQTYEPMIFIGLFYKY